jgi:hypothetical protein
LCQARKVDGYGQAEVADLGYAILAQPDVARFQVAMDDSFRMSEREAAANAFGDSYSLI